MRLSLSRPNPTDKLRLRRIFDENHDLAWRLLRRWGVPPERVEDAVQQVFLITAERLADIRSGSERAFVYGVAIRVARGLVKRGWREVLGDDADLRCSIAPMPDQLVEQRRLVELCDHALGSLRHDLREVFVLVELNGLTAPETAEILDVPVGTVASRLRRARELFRSAVRALEASPSTEVRHA